MKAFLNASDMGFEKFRVGQLYTWLCKGVLEFEEMKNIPQKLIDYLKENAYIAYPQIECKYVSKIDSTRKYLFKLHDGQCIESVVMKYNHGNTICISTQAGCRMGCAFCASTLGGKERDLTASEMTGQIYAAQRDMGERISNVVMMGIGEPLDNYEQTVKFLSMVNNERGLGIGYRHISLSTCGIVPKIYELAQLDLPITLSISLHNPFQSEREKIMPVAKKYDVNALMDACRAYFNKTGRRISFEYAMIDGHNDTPRHAHEIIKLTKGIMAHINLIPVNEVKEKSFKKSSRANIERFTDILEKAHLTATVRRTLGADINASCGQLRKNHSDSLNNQNK